MFLLQNVLNWQTLLVTPDYFASCFIASTGVRNTEFEEMMQRLIDVCLLDYNLRFWSPLNIAVGSILSAMQFVEVEQTERDLILAGLSRFSFCQQESALCHKEITNFINGD